MNREEAAAAAGVGDVALQCCDCGKSFVWTKGQQHWFEEKGLHAPRRCRDCVALKRARAVDGAQRGQPRR